jgi:hypothetical protein
MASTYTVALAKGQGMPSETILLLKAWQEGMSAVELKRHIIANGLLPKATNYRTSDLVSRVFAPRYLSNGATAAKNLKHLLSRSVPADRLLQLFLIYTARANLILRVAGLPWKPNLNDGVLITASPLWKLFRLSKWQKDLKTCWGKLEAGEYDWAHLAYTIWPDRVKQVCKKDRSIAIAHGLEDLCEVKAPEKKAKRGRKKADAELDLAGGGE